MYTQSCLESYKFARCPNFATKLKLSKLLITILLSKYQKLQSQPALTLLPNFIFNRMASNRF